jgi:flagellar biosynthesis/type III secretory pathway protein FliH
VRAGFADCGVHGSSTRHLTDTSDTPQHAEAGGDEVYEAAVQASIDTEKAAEEKRVRAAVAEVEASEAASQRLLSAKMTVERQQREAAALTAAAAADATEKETRTAGAGSGVEHGTQQGAEYGTQQGEEQGTHLGAEHRTQQGVEHGTQHGVEHGTQQGAEQGTQQGAEQGTHQGVEHGTQQGAEAEEHMDTADDRPLEVQVGADGASLSPPPSEATVLTSSPHAPPRLSDDPDVQVARAIELTLIEAAECNADLQLKRDKVGSTLNPHAPTDIPDQVCPLCAVMPHYTYSN